MIAAQPTGAVARAGDRSRPYFEDGSLPPVANDLFTKLCMSCGAQADGNWAAISETARTVCYADAAGVQIAGSCVALSGLGNTPGPLILDHLHAALTKMPKIARYHAPGGAHYIAAAIGSSVAEGYLWVRRRADFEWSHALSLRGLTAFATLVSKMQRSIDEAQLLMLESRHRCLNDLQLVHGLLNFEVAQSGSEDVRDRLSRVSARIQMLAHARRGRAADVATMLRDYCAMMGRQLEDRRIDLELEVAGEMPRLSEQRLGLLHLAVNEIVTNAIKHGFGDHRPGTIRLAIKATATGIRMTVADDGVAIADGAALRRPGSGLDLVARLLAGARGRLVPPAAGSKTFAIELPAQ